MLIPLLINFGSNAFAPATQAPAPFAGDFASTLFKYLQEEFRGPASASAAALAMIENPEWEKEEELQQEPMEPISAENSRESHCEETELIQKTQESRAKYLDPPKANFDFRHVQFNIEGVMISVALNWHTKEVKIESSAEMIEALSSTDLAGELSVAGIKHLVLAAHKVMQHSRCFKGTALDLLV